MKNDFRMEELLIELKDFQKEKQRLIDLANEMIKKYQGLAIEWNSQVEEKEKNIKDLLLTLLERDKMKETKTQRSHQLASGKIIISKDKYNMKLKDNVDDSEIPNVFVEEKRSIKWSEYKKTLTIVGSNVVDRNTGEIVNTVEIEKVEGGQIIIK